MWLLAIMACGGPSLDDGSECDACGGDCIVEEVTCGEALHVEGGVAYDDLPPACGSHDPCWTDWGVHEVDPGAQHWVHNLEHGGVAFLYDCTDCDEDVTALTELVAGMPDALLIPYDGLPTRFAAVAWGVRWLADCADVVAMEDFYATYRNQAPESVSSPPPASCSE